MGITMGARRNGKTARTIEAIRVALAAGEHVHLASSSGTRRTTAQLEHELKR